MFERRQRTITSFFFTLLLVSLIAAYPIKEAHAIIKEYPISSGEDDGYTFLLVTPGNPPQFTEYFIEDEEEIIMLSPSTPVNNWFRFQNIDIPRGAFITSAYLRVIPTHASAAALTNIRIQGFAEDNPTAPTDYGDFINRPKTSAYIDDFLPIFYYMEVVWIGLDNVIQEIVNRPGWKSGNSIVICSSADVNGFPKSVHSYETTTAIGIMPVLEIEYIAPTQAPTVTFTYSPTSPKVGEIVWFNASGSTDPD